MKKVIFILLMFVFNAYGAPCGGAPALLHTNPNGSPGGLVAKTAFVSKSALIDSSSSVCGNARVNGSAKILRGSEIGGNVVIDGSPTIDGSKVYGDAVVTGGFRIVNSVVCQASRIIENVIRSDYYCQTDDPEPKDPGEAGKKTLLGVDSDVDGVRDDVEIWINQNTSNTPTKNMFNPRMALKQVAKKIQENIKMKDNKERSVMFSRETLVAEKCLSDFMTSEEARDSLGMLKVKMFNTMDRLKAWARTEGNFNGQSITVDSKRKKGDGCEFNYR